jgi:hypothetical protein
MTNGGPPQYPPPGQYQQPGQYPQQPGYGPGQYGQPPKTNGMAVAALVLGILWVCWVGSILAVIFGYMAKRQIRDSGGVEQGDGMATAGIVLGWIGVATLILYIVLIIAGAASLEFQST